jgi:4-hydroxy-3-methylbut-2-en-1-yl diphosphate reductase
MLEPDLSNAGRRILRTHRPGYGSPVTAVNHPAVHAPAADRPAPDDPAGARPRRRRVLLAAPRGYCAGVERAIRAVELALERHGAPVYVRHEIVHNEHVVASLAERGAVFISDTDDVPEGAVVVFSAHGVEPAVHAAAERRSLSVIDATCPLVTKVHKEARRFAEQGYDILLVGHQGHEEVIGTAGEAPDRITVVDGAEAIEQVQVRDPAKVVWLSQTTLSVDETMDTVRRLKERFPLIADPPSDDICYATQNRQLAVRAIARDAELVLVVGSSNSSNSLRLVDVARQSGAARAELISSRDAVQPDWLDGVWTVGLTSGASAPETLVAEVLELLAERGFDQVEPVQLMQESLTFALPHPLRTAAGRR